MEHDRQAASANAGYALIEAIAGAVAYRLQHFGSVRQRLLTLEQAEEYLGGISEDGIRRLISEGRLKPSRIDRRIRLDVRELDRLIEETKVTGPVSPPALPD